MSYCVLYAFGEVLGVEAWTLHRLLMSVDTNVFIKYTKVTLHVFILFFAKFEFRIISK